MAFAVSRKRIEPAPPHVPSRGPASSWLTQLCLVPSPHVVALAAHSSSLQLMVGFMGDPPRVTPWHQALERHHRHNQDLLIRHVIRAEARGWLVVHARQPCPALDAADFLGCSGLLSPEQLHVLFAGVPAQTTCSMWQLGRTLVARRWLNGVDAGFMNRLGRLCHWQVGSVTPASTSWD